MNLNETRKGELLIFSKSLLTGLFPVITVFSLYLLPSFTALFSSTAIAAIFFAFILLLKNKFKEIFSKQVFYYSLVVTLTISVGYYGFYFLGLKHTSAGNASIISLMETFFTFLLFNIWKKEFFSKPYLLGALLMIFGATLVLFPKATGLNIGDILILCSAAMAPVGNDFQQRLRSIVSAETILFLRCALSLPFLAILIFVFKETSNLNAIQKSLPFLLLNGVLVLGFSKILWIEAIHRISVTKASALNSLNPFITLIFSFLILKQTPTFWQIAALAPIFIGVLLLTSKKLALPTLGPD